MRKHWKLIWRVRPYLRPYKHLAASSMGLTVLGALIALAEPWPLALLVDGVLGNKNGRPGKPLPKFITSLFGHRTGWLIAVIVLIGLLIALLINTTAVLTEYVNTKLSQEMIVQFRVDLVENALQQTVAFHDARSRGDFIARINYESSSMGSIAVAIPPLVQSVLTLGGMAYIAFRLDHLLAILALVVVPFIYYSTGYYGKHIEPQIRRVRGIEGRSLTIVYEAMAMLRVITVFNRERYEHKRFHDQARQAVDARIALTVRQSLFSFAINVITAVGTALVLGVGALHVIDGRLTVGELLVLISYVHSVYTPLQAISASMASFQEQFIYLAMSLELLDNIPEIRDAPGAIELPPVRGAVEFDHVDFAYAGRAHTLDDITFKVDPGETIAVVGPTGAGKTTLMSLLSRLCEAQVGSVLIDGIDVRAVTLDSLRSQISVVPQEPMLFTGTVRENIRYGDLHAGDEDVVRAATAANADEFITQLPEGYDTVLGENGTALSGGEKQRICVARAFLKDAPILVLDEPTSSIDSRTEAVILDALERLMEGRTTFMIAHRLSTLRAVDRILVIDHGQLVEEGTHPELLKQGGLYRLLHEVQAHDQDRYHDDLDEPDRHNEQDERPEAPPEAPPASPLGVATQILHRVLERLQADEAARPALPAHASIIAQPNPVIVDAGETMGVTEIMWTAIGCSRVEVHVDAPDGPLFAAVEYEQGNPGTDSRVTGLWVRDGMIFYLQDKSHDQRLIRTHTLASVTVRVIDPSNPRSKQLRSNGSASGNG